MYSCMSVGLFQLVCIKTTFVLVHYVKYVRQPIITRVRENFVACFKSLLGECAGKMCSSMCAVARRPQFQLFAALSFSTSVVS